VDCGAILDEEALYNHLKACPTFLAGIDTWWQEPLTGESFHMSYPFLELPNVLGSPHNSALVPQVIADAARQAAANVKHFLLRGDGRRHDRGKSQEVHRKGARLMRTTYKYRLYPHKTREKKLYFVLNRCRELYNAALSERKDAYRMAGKSISYYEQQNNLPETKGLLAQRVSHVGEPLSGNRV
jgi:Helix-turn-helix domain/D-isomer specific 2-hydroxyacid dehydrogenase, NAD binding domain